MSENRNTRLRAAWLYYAHGLTQAEIATRLRLSRATVNKLLDTARSRGEVRIWLDEPEDECLALALEIERALGVDAVIVVPEGPEGSTRAAGLALGRWLSMRIEHNMRVGVGWGRTLMAALEAFQPPRRDGVEVISLLGGQVRPALPDPAEFAWRMASALGAECLLLPAPLLVDSAETRHRLIAACGLDALFERAGALDIAVLSVGTTEGAEGSLALRLLTEGEQAELRAAGAVGDVLAHFLDASGASVDHPANRRAMAVDLDRIARAKTRLLTATGAARAPALRAAQARLGANVLILDEGLARALLG